MRSINSKSELNKLEVYYIELYQTFDCDNGLNLTKGGDGYDFKNNKHTKWRKK